MVHPELAAEQAHVDRAYERVEVLQQKAKLLATSDLIVRASGPAATVERDVREATGARRLRGLRFGSVNLCFGRIDRTDGQVFHVGRLGVSDEGQEPLVVDWRAPVAEAFYRATAVEPMGLRRRRHLLTRGRLVLGIDDEVLQDGRPPGTDDLVLVGEGALLESLGRARTGRMSDIVGTIQAEQDRIIRAPLAGTLVVQGGPGTGKTAVALHRAAYLLFTHRLPLEERGVLVVGPNPVFLRYIERVLPSLGESGCRLTTTAELVETASVTALMSDSPDARRVKGDARMVDVMANALRSRQRPLARPVEVPFGAFRLPVGRRASASIVEVGRAKGVPHNAARPAVEQVLVNHLFRRYEVAHARALEAGLARAGRRSRAEVVPELRRSRAVRTVLDRIWPVLSPEQLLHDLLSREPLLAEAAGELLCEEDRHAVRRDPDAATWSPADLPLLDEADRLLGRRSTPRPPRAVADPDADAMVERMLDDMHEAGVLFEGDPSMTRDVRNHLQAKDRPAVVTEAPELRTYGHVVVDEAQDLSPMEWRMIARRCPSGSMTVVGDLGQASGWWKADSWADVMTSEPLGPCGRAATTRRSCPSSRRHSSPRSCPSRRLKQMRCGRGRWP